MINAAVFGPIKDGRPNVSNDYIRHIAQSNVNAVILHGESPGEAAKRYDCLVVCGGGDMDPSIYGQLPIKGSKYDRQFDIAELGYINAFISAKRPVLGICRGMQSVNVALGGTLIQDIPSMLGLTHLNCGEKDCEHEIKISKASSLYKALGLRAIVNSRHHQCVHTTGSGLYIAAASHDGIIEAIENSERGILGVQWHPERMSGNAVFDHFFNEYVKISQA